MTRAILAALLLVASASADDDPARDIVTTKGVTYSRARITELRLNGVAVTTDSGISVIPYAQLPKDLQARYVPIAEELAKAIGTSLDGTYELPPERTGVVAVRLVLRDGTFVYQAVSDIAVGTELRGRFTRTDQWITFHHKDFSDPIRILAVLNGKLTLFTAQGFKTWRDTGNAAYVMTPILQRNDPK